MTIARAISQSEALSCDAVGLLVERVDGLLQGRRQNEVGFLSQDHEWRVDPLQGLAKAPSQVRVSGARLRSERQAAHAEPVVVIDRTLTMPAIGLPNEQYGDVVQ
ncbi:hypothetical protein [Pseudomonas sp. NPDC089396]|uniref:hypothetical protein n=1 Tax=Pseudomonas sp. NPDC089396 TaxID=3364461 RepID=UPI00383506CA